MKKSTDSLGDRMKEYEAASQLHLPRRMPVIIRLDGRAFHTLTQNFRRPYDARFMSVMDTVTLSLLSEVTGAVCAYAQSDEVSLAVVDYQLTSTQAWFANNLQKLVSVSAGVASACMTLTLPSHIGALGPVTFDSRAFVLPKHEVVNYFIWRQQDWQRNSLQMLARSLYSHKQLQGKKTPELHDLCMAKGENWAKRTSHEKDGRFFTRAEKTGIWELWKATPLFTQSRGVIDRLVNIEPQKDKGV